MYINNNIILLECDVFQKKVVQKNHLFRKSCRLWDKVENFCPAGQATDDNITRRMRLACWINKAADVHWEYAIQNSSQTQHVKHN